MGPHSDNTLTTCYSLLSYFQSWNKEQKIIK